MQRQRKKAGQALVEFALFVTLLMTMLSAVIDVGLAFFAWQGISGAALEGASYIALVPKASNGTFTAADNEARNRVHYEGGRNANQTNRARFVNLMDLNNNNAIFTADSADNAEADYIVITSVSNANNISDPPVDCNSATMGRKGRICDMKVTVKYKYVAKFFLARVFGRTDFMIEATRQVTIQTY